MIIVHKGQRYCATGKEGTHIKTGASVIELSAFANKHERIWVAADGTVYED